jgi:hypothetical protein
VLNPIKRAILFLERKDANLADCYVELLRIGISYQNLLTFDYNNFKNYCIKKYNER